MDNTYKKLFSIKKLLFLFIMIYIVEGETNRVQRFRHIVEINRVQSNPVLDEIFLDEREAKVLLKRHKRAWIELDWIIGEDNKEETHERTRESDLLRSCQDSCWGSWGAWEDCSLPCGSEGIKYSNRTQVVSTQCHIKIDAHGCPGSNQRSAACGQSCKNSGTLLSKSCSCRIGFVGSCCEQTVTCQTPGEPANGEVHSDDATYDYNAKITYSCDAGYHLVGPTSNQCTSSGTWRNQVPSCHKSDSIEEPDMSCQFPGKPANGRVDPDKYTYDYNAKITYSCDAGYHLVGPNSNQCVNSGIWRNQVPSCHSNGPEQFPVWAIVVIVAVVIVLLFIGLIMYLICTKH